MPEESISIQCCDCKIPKPLSDFSRNKTKPLGHNSQCKACHRKYAKLHNLEHFEEIKLKKRAYSQTPEGKAAHKKANAKWIQTERGRRSRRASNQRGKLTYAKKYPERAKAREAMTTAIASRRLVRPKNCQQCGAATHLQGHHYLGYEREHWLDVKWLCRPCHLQSETRSQPTGPAPSTQKQITDFLEDQQDRRHL